jgi:hypothetical protein
MSNAMTAGTLFPGMSPHARTYAAWPVWKDSTSGEVKFAPMTRKAARRIWHDARRFERQTRVPGRQDGAIGRNGLAILHCLLFDFLNWRSGALYPSQAAIADKAAISESSVTRGLAKLKAAGVVSWLRRCAEVAQAAGGFLMRQISNAYAVLPTSQWKGYKAPPEPPAPAPSCWGARPPEDHYAEAKTSKDDWARLAALEAEAATGSGIARIHAADLRRRLLYSSAIVETVSLTMKPDPASIPNGRR